MVITEENKKDEKTYFEGIIWYIFYSLEGTIFFLECFGTIVIVPVASTSNSILDHNMLAMLCMSMKKS
jgi:hypothetical protein